MTEAEIARELMAGYCQAVGGTFHVSDDPEEFGGKIAVYYYTPWGKGYAAVAWTASQALEELARKLETEGDGGDCRRMGGSGGGGVRTLKREGGGWT